MFQIDYPEIVKDVVPKHRFMSAYEQRMEPPDKKWQYLLFAAEPYETISFKVLVAFYFVVTLFILSRLSFIKYCGAFKLLLTTLQPVSFHQIHIYSYKHQNL